MSLGLSRSAANPQSSGLPGFSRHLSREGRFLVVHGPGLLDTYTSILIVCCYQQAREHDMPEAEKTCEICGEPVDADGRTTEWPIRNTDDNCSECGRDLFEW